MAEVTNELLYEVLKQVQQDTGALKEGQRETRESLAAIRTYMVALQQDVSNIYSILARHELRLGRIERRLEISEVS
jgi:hypothetical protein